MYQSEMKEGFIKDYMRSRVIARTSLYSLFRKTELFEEENKKDCSHFVENEILAMYTKFNAKSVYVLMNYNTILKAYCRWRRHYCNENVTMAYEAITIDLLKPCVPKDNNKFISREEMSEIEDKLYNWTDRAIIECLWEGISGPSMTELVSLKRSMLDYEEKTIYFKDGKVIHLSARLFHILIKAFEEREYLCYGATLRVKKLLGVDSLYKEMDNTYADDSSDKYFRWVYRKVQNFREHLNINGLTMKNIQSSGLYHYLREGMDETGLDLRNFLKSEDGKKLAEKYGFHSDAYVDNLTHRFKDYV